jgi:CRISPR-associated protein Cas5d
MPHGIQLLVNGDFACFTRPEMKVERVSYDVMTPSAARGILEAIYWKPEIRWIVTAIHVLKPIRFTNIRRNEVSDKAAKPTAAMLKGEPVEAPGILIEDARQQRASTLLRDVAYIIQARFEIISGENNPGKHLDMFNRRARQGQCFHQPYFGTREFPAAFELIEANSPLPTCNLPEDQRNRFLGWMLHDIAFLPATKNDKDSFLDGQGRRIRTEPRFFEAKLENGILHVPPFETAKG